MLAKVKYSVGKNSFSNQLRQRFKYLLQVNLNELDQQMEQIKEMFVKKQEMMKKMSSATAPDPAQLATA